MGSHGGANAAGQRALLASYDIDEAHLGPPVLTDMDPVDIGTNNWGQPVWGDTNALARDAVRSVLEGDDDSWLRLLLAHGLTAADPINDAIRKSRGGPEPYDGTAELWFDSVEAMTAPGATPEGKAAMKALREDEARFIDGAGSPVWVGEEHPVLEG